MISRDRCLQEAGSRLTLDAGFQESLEFGLFEGHGCLLLERRCWYVVVEATGG